MKIAELHKAKRPGRAEPSPFTPEQAMANRELLMQLLRESRLTEAAAIYFRHFFVGKQFRNWLLPSEDISDLKDTHVNHVIVNWPWYRSQLAKVNEYVHDQIPGAEV